MFTVLHEMFTVLHEMFTVLHEMFTVLHEMFNVLPEMFTVLHEMFTVLHEMFTVFLLMPPSHTVTYPKLHVKSSCNAYICAIMYCLVRYLLLYMHKSSEYHHSCQVQMPLLHHICTTSVCVWHL